MFKSFEVFDFFLRDTLTFKGDAEALCLLEDEENKKLPKQYLYGLFKSYVTPDVLVSILFERLESTMRASGRETLEPYYDDYSSTTQKVLEIFRSPHEYMTNPATEAMRNLVEASYIATKSASVYAFDSMTKNNAVEVRLNKEIVDIIRHEYWWGLDFVQLPEDDAITRVTVASIMVKSMVRMLVSAEFSDPLPLQQHSPAGMTETTDKIMEDAFNKHWDVLWVAYKNFAVWTDLFTGKKASND